MFHLGFESGGGSRRKRSAQREFVWKHRIAVGLVFILVLQASFLTVKLTVATDGVPGALVQVLHVLLTSGLAVYMFSKGFETRLQDWLYGHLRHDWKEVKVYYSEGVMMGMGGAYPREPTLLIHSASMFGEIDHPMARGVMTVSFNNSLVGIPPDNGDPYENGKWSQLQPMRTKGPMNGFHFVGFPDTMYLTGGASPEKMQEYLARERGETPRAN